MVQGFDMYKFLANSIYSAYYYNNKELGKEVVDLFKFYGDKDPYKIMENPKKASDTARKEYCRRVTYSSIAQHTPLEFLSWIMINYHDIISKYITVKSRDIYVPLKCSTLIEKYNDIFKNKKQGRQYSINLLKKCINHTSSYLLNSYNIHILTEYNRRYKSQVITNIIANLEIANNKKIINNDVIRLYKYKNIIYNSKFILSKSNTILKIKLCKKRMEVNTKIIEQYIKYVKFVEFLEPYLQMYYTIKEIELDKHIGKYKDWCKEFLNSEIYKTYTEYINIITIAKRWIITLKEIYYKHNKCLINC